ncbi:Fe-S cluster biogenesis protein NfuA [Litorimonas taeanensis]|uniref:Fe-S cluster biogenesis protein NfuA n=2 Tax=Litorimonas taeanensis TaxID=568099 RepID=A0A420WEV0_9PROT|nr:Fe-S cluster biogenesis protein NfuA [Litorimonas taeanensis]
MIHLAHFCCNTQLGAMFIQTEDTPNPATLKFLPGRDVVGEGGRVLEFTRGEDVSRAPLAEMLFMIPDVERVFFGTDYVSVTRSEDVQWKHLKPAVLGAIMDFYVAGGVPLLDQLQSGEVEDRVYEGVTLEIVEQIKELIELRVRPAVAQDGGDIVFKHFDEDDGSVYLEMRGACAGCPSSTMTLKSGIENLLKHYVPEVTRVEQAV